MNIPVHSHRVLPVCLLVRIGSLVLIFTALSGVFGRAQEESDKPQGRLITSLAIAINRSTHKVYAVNERVGTVSVIDERTGSTGTVKVGNGPIALAVNHKTNRIYV